MFLYCCVQVRTSILWLKWMLLHCWRSPPSSGLRGSGWTWLASLERTCSSRSFMIVTLRLDFFPIHGHVTYCCHQCTVLNIMIGWTLQWAVKVVQESPRGHLAKDFRGFMVLADIIITMNFLAFDFRSTPLRCRSLKPSPASLELTGVRCHPGTSLTAATLT